jgi:formate dehydrogenase accessory protein FdhE
MPGGRGSVWTTRRARALALAATTPHAEEILRCYAEVTEAQEGIAARVPVERWLGLVGSADDGPALRLERLPLDDLLPLFDEFLDDTADVGTPVMTAEAARLRGVGAAERRALLETALGVGRLEDHHMPFHAQAFLEAVATTLAARILPSAEPEGPTSGRCRTCGAQAVVATLRDLPNALGSRGLVCGLCGTEQRIPRLTCAHCGETSADRLHVHSAESVPHVRLDECESCQRYIKTVDLRRRGDAVPVVEEIATVELDMWAKDRGLVKVQPNVFGL